MPHPNCRNRDTEVDFKGGKRSNGCHWNAIGPRDNGNHASRADPEARLYKKSPGTGAMLCFMGHALMENRHGFVVQGDLTRAPSRRMPAFAGRALDGNVEWRAALDMVHRHSPGSTRRLTPGADKGYDEAKFVSDLRQAWRPPACRPEIAIPPIDGRTTRHEGYALSPKHRKRIEEPFGWAKTVGGMAQTVYRGIERVRSCFILTIAANNLARLPQSLGA